MQTDADSSKRKRQKSTDSHQKRATRPKNQKRSHTSDSEQKEDGEISDENDSEEDDDDDDDDVDHLNREQTKLSQRRQIVYEISDDSCSSSASGRNSPYAAFTGEQMSQKFK